MSTDADEVSAVSLAEYARWAECTQTEARQQLAILQIDIDDSVQKYPKVDLRAVVRAVHDHLARCRW